MPMARCGTNDCSVHRGQVGQPSPDPVSRTTPPVTTISTFTTREDTAAGRIHRCAQERLACGARASWMPVTRRTVVAVEESRTRPFGSGDLGHDVAYSGAREG